MPSQSAGLAMYRRSRGDLEILLVHPGGPFWANKDEGAWTLPKGELALGEDPITAAQREFVEETGFPIRGPLYALGSVEQAGGKTVFAWAFEGDGDVQQLKSNLCQIEWPPRSKRFMDVPEVDRGEWFTMPQARQRISKSQQPFLERLQTIVSGFESDWHRGA